MTSDTRDALWYVVHTKPQKEILAASMLEDRLSLNVYLPEVLQRYRGRTQLRPFFPRYVFVQVDLASTTVSAIDSLPGVIRLVSFGDKPRELRPDMVAAIRQRVDGYNAEGGMPQHDFRPGDRVQIKSGPLQGLEAVFQGPMKPSQRALVLMEFLGRLHEAEVPVDQLERMSNFTAGTRRRTSRGRGRPLHRPAPTESAA